MSSTATSVSPRPAKVRRLSHTLTAVQMPAAVNSAKEHIESSKAAMTTSAANVEPVLLVSRNKEHPNAKLPTRGSALAAGYDLYASSDAVIPKRGRAVVQTGIHVAVPVGCYGRVAPRSGLASKHGIDVGAGVVDADYRGLLGVLLFNFTDEDFQSEFRSDDATLRQAQMSMHLTVKTGDRIAQLVLERICLAEVQEVEVSPITQCSTCS